MARLTGLAIFLDYRIEPAYPVETMKQFLVVLLLSIASFAQSPLENAKTCQLSKTLDSITATTELVAAPAATSAKLYVAGVLTSSLLTPKVKICSVDFLVKQAGGAADFGLVYGTGTNCATGKANLTPQWTGTASVIDKWSARFGADTALEAPAGKAVCAALSATPTKGQVLVTYKIE